MSGPVERLARALVSRPWIYERVQDLTGQARSAAHLSRMIEGLGRERVLDVGSSSGELAVRLGLSPCSVDVDVTPLAAMRRRRGRSGVVAADAARLPFAPATFDLTLCVALCHHVDDELLGPMLAELARVTAGHLAVLEPLRNDARAVSRWLWRYDRGRHPRRREDLEARVRVAFRIERTLSYRIYHDYWICVARPAGRSGDVS